jgi:putative transposase
MHQAHKIRLNPTPDQAAYFRRATGTQRFVFNWGLARIKEALDAGETPPHVLELKKAFNAIKGEQFPWVYEVTKCAVEGGFQNLQAALSNFFQSKKGQRKGKRMGFPHRKSRKWGYGSLTLANDKVSHEGHTVTIPRLGKVNMTEAVRFEGKLLKATVSYLAGWWWISFTLDVPHDTPEHQGHAIGIDVGVKDLAVDSDGQRYENQAPLRRSLRQLRRACRKVSRRIKGSKNHRKAVLKVARLHYRIRCQRVDAIHKATAGLVQRASLIGIEDLHIAGMLRNRRLARSLSDASMSEFHRQLTYKAEWHGAVVQRIGRFFPSSQIHHGCGGRKTDLTLNERHWVCPACGALVERDLNAALNIRDEALRLVQRAA